MILQSYPCTVCVCGVRVCVRGAVWSKSSFRFMVWNLALAGRQTEFRAYSKGSYLRVHVPRVGPRPAGEGWCRADFRSR